MMGLDEEHPDSIAVPMKVLAAWLGCTPRSAQMAIRELTRSGPIPLLRQNIGMTGRVSRYHFIEDPFAEAHRQQHAAARLQHIRQPQLIAERNAAFLAHQRLETTSTELATVVRTAEGRAKWGLPTRRLPSDPRRRFRP